MYITSSRRWQNDSLCDRPFPKTFREVKRTIENIRQQKYGKAPRNCLEIQAEFQKADIFENLCLSRHRDRGIFFNTAQIINDFENRIFSSAKSISLIKENIDATFRVSPQGIFNQLLVIHVQYGKKTFPVVYALMSKKSTKAYLNVLQYVHENLIPIAGDGIIIG